MTPSSTIHRALPIAGSMRIGSLLAHALKVALFLFAVLFVSALAFATPNASEEKLITTLISEIGSMQGIVFIRNGSEYDATDAAKHLREKFDYFKADIRTADDFIRLCATRSEMSGKPYMVRLSNGNTLDSADFLADELRKLRKKLKG